ncbi:hypothetical protein BY458DRAFT_510338 [Sporodiniella umbellata]|nr:hypothetical protein BY458DRAFT_510338 [Sporodiniella umbellata]
MSSPVQPPPPNIRSPNNTSQQVSPYTHHLPLSNLPPRATELPSILSAAQSSASPSNYVPHSLPPPSTMTEQTVLPPSHIPSRTSTPPTVVRVPTPENQNGYRPLNVRDALTYLDQVKVRFSDQPEVYNRFLDIMKDFKSQVIDTPGVIDRVSTLFKGHPTLISGFNTFLPPGYRIECSTDPREPDLITVTTPSGVTTTTGRRHPLDQDMPPAYYPYIHNPPLPPQIYRPPPPPPPPPASGIPRHRPSEEEESPLEFNHAINYVNRIKNRYAREPDVYKQFLEILQTYQKDNKPIQEVYSHVQYLFHGAPDLLEEFKQFLPDITGQPSLFDSMGSKRNNNKRKRSNKRPKYKENGFSFSSFDASKPAVSTEEIELFERIRKHIGNKPSYEEFLKTLNLYTQHIITMDTLVEQVSVFIGNNRELSDWFKSMIGYEPKESVVEKPMHSVPKPDLNTCQTTGTHESPSYRVVPKEWQNQPCSGRDQLCWEVLNDEYVSHPIWASEEDGFVASKKSQYEEAMHRCEEERYEHNVIIDANLTVIALLEPISQRIEQMTDEEKANFKMKPGLGGESVTIYERIIKKIYEKERGLEIIELLYSNPSLVVPIVLKRLKQKDEEWKSSQREWNKIWRELDARNFYRALDYQGITFKSNDRKAMAPKALVSEIENAVQQDKKKKRKDVDRAYQFKYDFKDKELYKDVTRVIYSFVDRQSGYTNSDRERVRLFIQTFIPLYFQVDQVESEEDSHSMHYKNEDDIVEEEDDNRSTNTDESDTERKSKRMLAKSSRHDDDQAMDLLRDLLTKNPEPTCSEDKSRDSLSHKAASMVAPYNTQKRKIYTLFSNTSFYCFFRLYQMLYERLDRLKTLNNTMEKIPMNEKRANKVAIDLGLYSARYEDVDLSKGYYQTVLSLIDKFFDGDIDQTLFEEYTRYIFVTDAYLLFAIDKLVHTMVKQIQTIVTEIKSVELMCLFKSDKALEFNTFKTSTSYMSKAKDIIGFSDNLYKISFDNQALSMTIQLVNSEEHTSEPLEGRYNNYVSSYMNWADPTDNVDVSLLKPSFLHR